MAYSDTTRFSDCGNIDDDAVWVHLALSHLGFSCPFSELPTIADMQTVLQFALHLKLKGEGTEVWES